MWHEYLTDLSTSPVRCSYFTSGNPKSHFSTLLFIYLRLFTLPRKKTNSNCCTAALAVYLLLFSASYYLHSPSTASGARYMIRPCWGLRQRFVKIWAEFHHTVVSYATDQCRKDWKHVLSQKVVILNTCCGIACLTFQLPHITTGSFQSQRRQPTTGSLQSPQRLKQHNKPSAGFQFCNS